MVKLVMMMMMALLMMCPDGVVPQRPSVVLWFGKSRHLDKHGHSWPYSRCFYSNLFRVFASWTPGVATHRRRCGRHFRWEERKRRPQSCRGPSLLQFFWPCMMRLSTRSAHVCCQNDYEWLPVCFIMTLAPFWTQRGKGVFWDGPMLQPGDGKRHRGGQKVSPATRFAFIFWTFFATCGESSMPEVSSLQNLNMKGANNIKRLIKLFVMFLRAEGFNNRLYFGTVG